ncbi:DeoR family transcriptional regulator [Undibacterium jejuense]|uniref:DeoR family transcriptional regulator n=1 Tax=Undibacterium jejuense TaxID=1344949 RepID=A0A923KJA4_9BURK|nr:DeoR family transcriptional regulator [Undibacterium jejuense]MBC3863967.1 DeoR family transcriptional regulator [Undibacterium jejuense]
MPTTLPPSYSQTSTQTLNLRQQEMLANVQREGFASVEQLAAQYRVTQQTIRRDINLLADMNLLRRFHGGVGLTSSAENMAYNTRQTLLSEEKRRIAALVARHIPDQATLFINLGTTTEEIARALCHHRNLRVITNNMNVASIMSNYQDIEVIVTGGVVRPRDGGLTGEAAVDVINQFQVDFGIIGISGIEMDGTLREFDYREVRVSEAIIKHSRTVFLAADHSKFDRPALVKLGHLSQIDVLFTDKDVPEQMHATFDKIKTKIMLA